MAALICALLFVPSASLASSTGGVGSGEAATTSVSGSSVLDGRSVVLPGQTILVRAAAPGVSRVTFLRAGRVLKAVVIPGGSDYQATFKPARPGLISVEIDRSPVGHVDVLRPAADLSDRGINVRFLQVRLRALGYATPTHSRLDQATARAVVAYRKVNDLPRTTNATGTIFAALSAGRGAYRARFPKHGRHVEADLTHQVLALVNPGGRVFRVYVTSSGRPSLPTPTGTHRVYRQERGRNGAGQWNTSYFKRNCGVHGYFAVPTYQQSHCCLRLPISDSYYVRDWMRVGMIVDVFNRRRAA